MVISSDVEFVRSTWYIMVECLLLLLVQQTLGHLSDRPIMVDLTIEEGQRLKVLYGSCRGFHAVDLDTMDVFDIYIPQHVCVSIRSHCLRTLTLASLYLSESCL